MELISKKAAIERIKKQMDREEIPGVWADNDRIAKVCYEIVIDALKVLPAIEAEPVRHGHWIPYSKIQGILQCSACGFLAVGSKYCPDCGALMDGGDDDGTC